MDRGQTATTNWRKEEGRGRLVPRLELCFDFGIWRFQQKHNFCNDYFVISSLELGRGGLGGWVGRERQTSGAPTPLPARLTLPILFASRPRLGDSDAQSLSWLSLFSLGFFSYAFCIFLSCILSVLSYAGIVKSLTCKRNASHEMSDAPCIFFDLDENDDDDDADDDDDDGTLADRTGGNVRDRGPYIC